MKKHSLTTLINKFDPSRLNHGGKEKINLNFHFHTLWCLEKFYEGVKGYLRCKTILCHWVALDISLMNFLTEEKTMLHSGDIEIFVFL